VITSTAAGLLILKVTLWFTGALLALPMLRRATASLRHLLCASALAGSLLLPWTVFIQPRVTAFRVPLIVSFTSTTTGVSRVSAVSPFAAIFILWMIGVVLLLLRIAIGWRRMNRALDRAVRLSDGSSVPVYAADVPVPLITGLVRPVILLPLSCDEWPPSQRDAALKHELTHLKRGDLWTSLVAQFACAVYWFHPLAWVLANRLRHEQEAACDDAVLHSGFEAAAYAEALVAAARRIASGLPLTPLIGCPMLTQKTETSLKSRIARLLDRSMPRVSSSATLRRSSLACAAALVAIGMLNAGPQSASPDRKAGAQVPDGRIRVYKMADGVTPPRVLSKTEPEYSEEARDAKIEGALLLSVVVGTDGLAHDISVVRGLGAGLEEKAVEAVEKWHFRPGELNGEAVPVQAQIEINFRLM
jgi:TonB family protein